MAAAEPHAMRSAEEDVLVMDDALREQLLVWTHGAAAPCYQCGVCTATCPWGLVRAETVSVRRSIAMAQLGLRDGSESLWLCTMCAHCEVLCPRGVPVRDVFRGIRYGAWEERTTPEGLPSLLWSVYWNNNPWSQPPSQRSDWAKGLELPTFDPEAHEVLLYVGCTSSYDPRAQRVARSVVRLLEAAGVQYGTLGEEEPCCGESVLSVGHEPYFQEVAEKAAALFHERGVARMVTVSPHCYDVFKNHYPRLDEGFEPVHYTEYLSHLVEEGRLAFPTDLDLTVTFHDPCALARHNGQQESPRRVLGAIPGVETVEMEQNGAETLCCGGGGGRMWMETAPGDRFSDIRVEQAQATGAQVLATACPFCISCLEDSLKARKGEGPAVMDVAEVAALALSP